LRPGVQGQAEGDRRDRQPVRVLAQGHDPRGGTLPGAGKPRRLLVRQRELREGVCRQNRGHAQLYRGAGVRRCPPGQSGRRCAATAD
ncbi:hypothetical protein ABTK74_20070, partial [Acinetobacter baumannii]